MAHLSLRMTVDSIIRGVKNFVLDNPPDKLGARLSVTFSNPGLNIEDTDSVLLELGVSEGGETEYFSLLEDGLVSGYRSNIKLSGDTLTADALNPLADKWQLVPPRDLIYYDPAKVNFDEAQGTVKTDIVDSEGDTIEPELIAVRDLSLAQVLDFAFVMGCGFTSVETNIPSGFDEYPIERADFSLLRGYYQGAIGFIALFEPLFFGDTENRLWIIDRDRQLPDGFVSAMRKVTESKYKETSIDKPSSDVINQIALTYRRPGSLESDTFPENATDRTEREEHEDGDYGEEGYTRTVDLAHFKDFHEDSRKPQKTTRSVEWKRVQQTESTDTDTGIVRHISTETTLTNYTRGFRLIDGYDKTVEGLVMLPNAEAPRIFVRLYEESSKITWTPSLNNPDEYIKVRSLTKSYGLILFEGDPDAPQDSITVMPLLEANLNRQVTSDRTQWLKRGPIQTKEETWVEQAGGQVNVYIKTTDHLTNHVKIDRTHQHIADRTVNIAQLESVTEIIPDESVKADPKVARVPLAINAGPVPYEIAFEVAERILKRRGQRTKTAEVVLVGFDPAIRRGSLRKIRRRDGSFVRVIVTGYRIQSEGDLGQPGARIVQIIQCMELTNE